MEDTRQAISVPPRIGAFLTQVTETTDLETALLKVLTEYLSLKTQFLKQRIEAFEARWEMTFDEFAKRIENDTLDRDPFSYDVESDFWEWEESVSLLQHYENLQSQWT